MKLYSKRLLVIPFIALFLLNSPIQAKINVPQSTSEIEVRTMDKRAEVLQAYLSKYNSPMKYQAQDFIDAADAYNMDWKLLPAIAGVESTFGKFIPGGNEQSFTSYNAWGWGVYGSQAIYFTSWREGMFTVAEGLNKNYFSRGLTDPYSINRMYSASSRWGTNVTYFLNDMERFEKQYNSQLGNAAGTTLVAQTAGQSAQIATTY